MRGVLAAGVVGVALLLGGCGSPSVPHVTVPDVERARASDPAITKASLDKGRHLYLARCTSCHQPFSPGSRTLPAWRRDVDEMRELAGLSQEDAALILAYLGTFARPLM